MANVDKGDEGLEKKRWLKALHLAKILFDDEGYFTHYLDQIEQFVKKQPLWNNWVSY